MGKRPRGFVAYSIGCPGLVKADDARALDEMSGKTASGPDGFIVIETLPTLRHEHRRIV